MQKIRLLSLLLALFMPSFGMQKLPQKQEMAPNLIQKTAAFEPSSESHQQGKAEVQPWLVKSKAHKQYRIEIENAKKENAKIPAKTNAIFRIMTYNVHYWYDPEDNKDTLNDIVNIIKTVNPDVAILQEVSPDSGFGNGSELANGPAIKQLRDAGFIYFRGCNTLPLSSWFGNVIISKVPFMDVQITSYQTQHHPEEKRCYVKVAVQVPTKGEVYLYGTHLEVKGSDDIRLAQIKEIADDIEKNNLKNKNVIIAADFNTIKSGSPIKFLQQKGFKDSFALLNWKSPSFTNWTGVEIDFLFLSPAWNLPIAGSYVYFDPASDHLPIFIDIPIAAQQPAPAMPAPQLQLTDQLIQAVKTQNLPAVNELLKRGAMPAAIGSVQESALHYAILSDQTGAIVARLLSIPGIDVNVKNTNYGQTPLYLTIDNPTKGLEYARMLIAKGARVNERTNKGASALHKAAAKGRIDLVQLFLDNGADIRIRDNAGLTPYKTAIANNRWQVAGLMYDWAVKHKIGGLV